MIFWSLYFSFGRYSGGFLYPLSFMIGVAITWFVVFSGYFWVGSVLALLLCGFGIIARVSSSAFAVSMCCFGPVACVLCLSFLCGISSSECSLSLWGLLLF